MLHRPAERAGGPQVEPRLDGDRAGVRVDEVAQCAGVLVGGQPGVPHLQRVEDPLGDGLLPAALLHPLDDLAEQGVGEVGVVEDEVRRQHPLGVLELAQQPLLVGGLEVLPDPAHRLALQPRGVRQHLPDRHRPVPGAGQVGVQAVVQRQPALVAQRHDEHGGEGLGDRADHVLRVVAGRHRAVDAGRADVAGPDQRPVADDAGADRRRAPVALGGPQPALEVADQAGGQGCVGGAHSADRRLIGP